MGAVKANWHLAGLELPDEPDDPFEISAVGQVIDLSSGAPELMRELRILQRRESQLYREGITCDLKSGGQDCRTCAECTDDPEDDTRFLCRVGKRQENAGEQLEAIELRKASARELAEARLLPAIDHAEAILPDLIELAEAMA